MAYEFKKLSEVEKLDSVPEGASVLAEVNGVIRRVPGSGLGSGSARETILVEQTLAFAQSQLVEAYQSTANIPFIPSVGEIYTVVWDGEEYTVIAFSDGASIGIGNASIPGFGEDTGEPFLYAVLGFDEEAGFFFTPSNFSSHTVAIYKDAYEGPPVFDMTAMGLPAIPLDSTQVSVECDTSELRAAAEKGVIKTVFAITIPGAGVIPVKMIIPMGYLAAAGAYVYSGMLETSGSVFALSTSVTGNGVFAKAIPLAKASG